MSEKQERAETVEDTEAKERAEHCESAESEEREMWTSCDVCGNDVEFAETYIENNTAVADCPHCGNVTECEKEKL